LFLRVVAVVPYVGVLVILSSVLETSDGVRVVQVRRHVAEAADPVERQGVLIHREQVDVTGDIDFALAVRVGMSRVAVLEVEHTRGLVGVDV